MMVTMATDTTDPRTDKLPKWAQDRMARLEAEAAYWKALYHAGPEDSDTFIETYEGSDKKGRPLGKSPQVRFEMSDGSRITVGFRRNTLQIHGVGTRGSDNLIVRPEASNVISVEVLSR